MASSLAEALSVALSAYEREPRDVNEIADSLGVPPRRRNAVLAARLAGTSDKRSRAYRSAMRSVQRWRRGDRRPSVASRRRLAGASPRRFGGPEITRMREAGALTAITATVQISRQRRRRRMPASGYCLINAIPVLNAWRDRDDERAAELFLSAFLRAYQLDLQEDELELSDIDSVEVRPA